MSSCPWCHLPVYRVQIEYRPDLDPIIVDPVPIHHPGPGDSLVAAKTITPPNGRPAKYGARLPRGAQPPRGHTVYAEHFALCELIAPDHPRRPARAATLLEFSDG